MAQLLKLVFTPDGTEVIAVNRARVLNQGMRDGRTSSDPALRN